jgi:hypothetical protein
VDADGDGIPDRGTVDANGDGIPDVIVAGTDPPREFRSMKTSTWLRCGSSARSA